MKLWSLDLDGIKRTLLAAVGLQLVPLSFDESRGAFDTGRVDGFFSPPTGALAFSVDDAGALRAAAGDRLDLDACVVVSTRAFDRLTFEQQRAVRAAAAKFMARFDDAGAHADEELIGGLFARQGVTWS